jgi:acid stress chaperone HdeB
MPWNLLARRPAAVRILLRNVQRFRFAAWGRIVEQVRRSKGTAMKFFAGLAMTVALSSCAPAMAEDIDLSAWTCKQFLAASKEDVGVILAWLDGYYKEEDEPPVIDTTALVVKAKKLGQYCVEHPDSDLISATDKLFQRE